MRITITESEKSRSIVIPTRLLLSSFGVRSLIKHLPEDAADNISPKAAKKLAAEFNRFRRRHKHWVLVEVEGGGSGEKVVITL